MELNCDDQAIARLAQEAVRKRWPLLENEPGGKKISSLF